MGYLVLFTQLVLPVLLYSAQVIIYMYVYHAHLTDNVSAFIQSHLKYIVWLNAS